jgi:hypothetical protein
MSHITKIAAVETAMAIWEYLPEKDVPHLANFVIQHLQSQQNFAPLW